MLTLALAPVAALLLVAVAALTDAVLPARGGDPDVELPEVTAVPTDSPLSPEEALALRQQVDPDRLRCEPRGCEVWRHRRTSSLAGEAVGDLVLLLEDGQLVALDAATGDERWAEPLDDLLPERERGGAAISAALRQWSLFAPLDDGVVLQIADQLVFVELDGGRRWAVPAPTGRYWYGEGHGRYVALNGEDSSGFSLVTVFDVADGSLLWEREGFELYATESDRAVLSGPDRVEVVDVADGTPIWIHEVEPGTPVSGSGAAPNVWLLENIVVTSWVDTGRLTVVDARDGRELWQATFEPHLSPTVTPDWVALPRGAGTLSLVDAATGQALTALDGAAVMDWTPVGDRWVLLLSPPADAGPDDTEGTLVGIDGGAVAWTVPVATGRRCCVWLSSWGRGVVSVETDDDTEGRRSLLRVDATTGERLLRDLDAEDRDWRDGWEADDGTWVEWDRDGVTLRNGDRRVRVSPQGAWPQSSSAPWVFATEFELLGVRLVPDG